MKPLTAALVLIVLLGCGKKSPPATRDAPAATPVTVEQAAPVAAPAQPPVAKSKSELKVQVRLAEFADEARSCAFILGTLSPESEHGTYQKKLAQLNDCRSRIPEGMTKEQSDLMGAIYHDLYLAEVTMGLLDIEYQTQELHRQSGSLTSKDGMRVQESIKADEQKILDLAKAAKENVPKLEATLD